MSSRRPGWGVCDAIAVRSMSRIFCMAGSCSAAGSDSTCARMSLPLGMLSAERISTNM